MPGINNEGNKKGGYTLMEVMIAMAIFTIGFLALGGLQVRYTHNNARARMITESTALADSTLSRLQALPFHHRDLDPSIGWHQRPAKNAGSYRVRWRVKADLPVKGTKTVSIMVNPHNRIFGKPSRLAAVIAE